MISNIRFKIIAGKIYKIPECYTNFARKNARLHNKTMRSRPGRGQMFEAEATSRPLWPRGLNITNYKLYSKLSVEFDSTGLEGITFTVL